MSDINRATAAILQIGADKGYDTRVDWRRNLIANRSGDPRPLLANALVALRRDPAWAGVLAFNDFAVKVQTLKPTPWRKPTGEQWTDNDDRLTAEWLQNENIAASTDLAGEAVQTVAMEHRFHPVRDYLKSLRWDGDPRVDTWVNYYLGVDPNKEISRRFGSLWLISAVARIMQPGCKADCCLIFEGAQGIGKSTAVRTLAGQHFTDQIAELGTKDAAMQCHGVWIVELAELDSINRTETSRIKAFMSATFDRFRLPYGKHIVEWPRDCVFAGSTNKDDYLRDESGGRRFWPIFCTRVDIPALKRDRDQIWAEAYVRYQDGEQWWLGDEQGIAAAEAEQSQRYEVDPWAERITTFTLSRDEVTVSEVLTHTGKPDGQWTRTDEMRVSAFLKSRGWDKVRTQVGTSRPWVYRRLQ